MDSRRISVSFVDSNALGADNGNASVSLDPGDPGGKAGDVERYLPEHLAIPSGMPQDAMQSNQPSLMRPSMSSGKKATKKERDRLAGQTRQSRLEQTVFSLVQSLAAGNEIPISVALLLVFLEDIQLLYYSWNPAQVADASSWAEYIWNPLLLRPSSDQYSSFLVVFAIALALALALPATTALVAAGLQGKKTAGVLDWLRFIAYASVGPLFIPILTALLDVFNCNGGHLALYPSVTCFGGIDHIIPAILSALGLLLFIPSALFYRLLLVDNNPRVSSKNALAKSHGRTDFLALIVKIVIVCVYEFAQNPSMQLGILLAGMAVILKEGLTKQPYYCELVQYLRNGIWMAAFLSALFSLCTYVTSTAHPVPRALLIISIPIGLALGVGLTILSFRLVTRRVYARFRQTVEKAAETSEGGLHVFTRVQREASIKDGGWAGVGKLADIVHSIEHVTTTKIKEDMACRFVRYAGPNTRALLLMREIFAAGQLQFARDGHVLASAAMYLMAFAPVDEGAAAALAIESGLQAALESNAERAEDILDTLANRPTPIDARYLAFLCEKTLDQSEQSKEANQSALNVSSYVEMLSQEKHAKAIHVQALNELKAYWTRVRRGVTTAKDFETFPSYLPGIAGTVQRAHDNYKKLIDRFPKSKNILRLYAQFYATLLTDSEESRKFMLLADDLDTNDVDEAASGYDVDAPPIEEYEKKDFSGSPISPTTTLKGRPSLTAQVEMKKVDSQESVSIDAQGQEAHVEPESENEHQEYADFSAPPKQRSSPPKRPPVTGMFITSQFRASSSHGGTSDTSESREFRTKSLTSCYPPKSGDMQ
ncbi:hypothetical protein M427DRAFT_41216 [Gonapodya prolifera JEL478]|uniref:TmcB/TmcC TPR repeats domain-containing protein n=1 Tax=Gonapodya prolifera (strain JEL478) TaxID=1344416 RepID=A0A139AUM8_GONPJ|nr:hypothetical protein M427DRAFT_41216 [Gonapodya prolifera JEL478]|eukprot:KXS20418.1 hypothetical protein M427DRAFT_41216 [Gonapodya prolifera JEL478]